LHPVLNEIGIEIHRLVVDGFDHEQSPDGINWAALSPATIKKRGTDAKKLRDTGSMFASLGHNASDSHVEITIGQNYAPFHQFGTSKMILEPDQYIKPWTELFARLMILFGKRIIHQMVIAVDAVQYH
jgi:phage gpG-like protein